MQLEREIGDEATEEMEPPHRPKTMQDYLQIWFMHNAHFPDGESPQRFAANAARAFEAALR